MGDSRRKDIALFFPQMIDFFTSLIETKTFLMRILQSRAWFLTSIISYWDHNT